MGGNGVNGGGGEILCLGSTEAKNISRASLFAIRVCWVCVGGGGVPAQYEPPPPVFRVAVGGGRLVVPRGCRQGLSLTTKNSEGQPCNRPSGLYRSPLSPHPLPSTAGPHWRSVMGLRRGVPGL